jgi:5'-methylthioadenosine phosphorylase
MITLYYITMSFIGVVSGTGLYELPGAAKIKKKTLKTPFGKPSGDFILTNVGGSVVVFLPRHGADHDIPPHMINYRANIWGFKELGVQRLISITAAGGINKGYKPGEFVILDQVIDMTQGGRASTFHDGPDVMHVDFTEPYCPELRKHSLTAGKKAGVALKNRGTYVCTQGPRLESRAEIAFFRKIGADVVGMTAMPEASLARELGICFLGISVVTNHAAGVVKKMLTVHEVVKGITDAHDRLVALLGALLPLIPEKKGCDCEKTILEARV